MKKAIVCLLLAGCLVPLAAEDYLSLDLKASLSVQKAGPVQQAIVDWVEERGGACVVWARQRLSLRLPKEKAGEFVALLKSLPGRVSGLKQSADEMRERIADRRTRIDSRKEVLRKNMEIMGRTSVVNTLDVEREITALIQEIEEAQGELRVLSYRTRFAYVELDFQFQATTRPENKGSAFPAVRELDMYDFITQMRERYETEN